MEELFVPDMNFSGSPDIFGQMNTNEFLRIQDELRKAMDAGHMVPSYAGGGAGGSLIPQSIENTLAWATLQNRHIRLWNMIPKAGDRLTATVHEYTRQNNIGPEVEGWSPEGVLGPTVDSELERLFQKCRYLSHVRDVTDPMSQVSILGPSPNAVAKVTSDATLFMLKMLENSLFDGDSDVNPDSIDGLYHYCSAVGNTYDNRGDAISTRILYDVCSTLMVPPIYGFPDGILLPVKVQTDLSLIGGDQVRFTGARPNESGEIEVGSRATHLIGPMEDIPFTPSVFLDPKGGPAATSVGTNPPATPTATVAITTDASSLFLSRDAGTYKLQVVAVGTNGEKSAPLTLAGNAIDAGEIATVNIAAPGTNNVKYYIFYRSEINGTNTYEIRRVRQAYTGSTPATTTFVDRNRYLPNTSRVYIIQQTPDVLQWKQLLDFARIPLAKTRLSQPYAFVLYGMLLSEVPQKLYCIENVGRLAT